jgi:trimethylamine--corrinoid protein Co-methyltransferase
MESAMMLTTAALSGVHLSLHACGTYGSMIAMSYEKFIADEDLCGALKKLIKPVEFTDDAYAMDLIKELGTSGDYLLQMHTVDRCRNEFFRPELSSQKMHNEWFEMKPREITQRAGMLLKKRLTEYEQPEIDSHLEKELVQYVRKRKHSN